MGRGLAYILGGALQGAGKGMVQKAEMDEVQRRDAALAGYRQEQSETEARLNDENNARSVKRQSDANIQEINLRFGNSLILANKSATAQKEAAVEEEARTKRLKKFESDLRKSEYGAQTAAEIEKYIKTEGTKIKDVVTDEETGAVSVIYENGSGKIVPGVIARKKDRPLVNGGPGATGAPGADPMPVRKFNAETGELE